VTRVMWYLDLAHMETVFVSGQDRSIGCADHRLRLDGPDGPPR
jgi:hypothetical protein